MLPAYDYCLKCSHAFNLLEARGSISVTERTGYIARVRELARGCSAAYIAQREEMGHPLLNTRRQAVMTGAFLLEIGTEEIPAGFIPKALERTSIPHWRKNWRSLQLPYREIRTSWALPGGWHAAWMIAPQTGRRRKNRIRPPQAGRFRRGRQPHQGGAGSPGPTARTRAHLSMEKTAKGEVVCLRKKVEGRETSELLSEFLSRVHHLHPLPQIHALGIVLHQLRPAHPLDTGHFGRKGRAL